MLKVIFGRRGSGKTTIISHEIPEYKKPVIIVDILGNFGEGGAYYNETWVQTFSVQECIREILKYRLSLRKGGKEKHAGIIVVQGGDFHTAIDYLCSVLWKIRGGTLVLDEGDAVSLADAPCLDEAIRYGRNRGIDLVFGCRRPAEISKNVTAGADRAFLLATHEPRDIEYYRDFLGDDDLAYSLQSLPRYHGIYVDLVDHKTGYFKTRKTGAIEYLSEYKREEEDPIQAHYRKPRPGREMENEGEQENSAPSVDANSEPVSLDKE